MWRRWLIFTVVAPVTALASAGCVFTAGATVFIADAIVAPTPGNPFNTVPPGLVRVRFFYDVRDGNLRIKGHINDPSRHVFMKLQGVLVPGKDGPQFNCMGAIVRYIPEDPNHPHVGDIVDKAGTPLVPNT